MKRVGMMLLLSAGLILGTVVTGSAEEVFSEVATEFEEAVEDIVFESDPVEEQGEFFSVFEDCEEETDIAAALNGFVTVGGVKYYYKDGVKAKGWQSISGYWYYFGTDGKMVTGFQKIGTTTYYFKTDGKMVTGLQTINSKIYFFRDNGSMKENGWKQVGSDWYYFENSTAIVNSFRKLGSCIYYFNSNGKMAVGFQTINGKRYYFRDNGSMKAGGWKQIGGSWYYFNNDGVMQTGLQQIGSVTYYFESDGKMAANKTVTVNGVTWKIDSSGHCTEVKEKNYVGTYIYKGATLNDYTYEMKVTSQTGNMINLDISQYNIRAAYSIIGTNVSVVDGKATFYGVVNGPYVTNKKTQYTLVFEGNEAYYYPTSYPSNKSPRMKKK